MAPVKNTSRLGGQPASKPVEVSGSADVIDTLTALGRLLIVVMGAVPTLRLLLGKGDFAGLLSYFEGSEGKGVAAAAVTIGTILYGLYKTHKRGAQIVTVASDPAVPDRVAKITR